MEIPDARWRFRMPGGDSGCLMGIPEARWRWRSSYGDAGGPMWMPEVRSVGGLLFPRRVLERSRAVLPPGNS
jgi:hypothetical protein